MDRKFFSIAVASDDTIKYYGNLSPLELGELVAHYLVTNGVHRDPFIDLLRGMTDRLNGLGVSKYSELMQHIDIRRSIMSGMKQNKMDKLADVVGVKLNTPFIGIKKGRKLILRFSLCGLDVFNEETLSYVPANELISELVAGEIAVVRSS